MCTVCTVLHLHKPEHFLKHFVSAGFAALGLTFLNQIKFRSADPCFVKFEYALLFKFCNGLLYIIMTFVRYYAIIFNCSTIQVSGS